MANEAEVAKIEAEHTENMRKARESLEYTVEKANRDYEQLIADYDAMREACLEA